MFCDVTYFAAISRVWEFFSVFFALCPPQKKHTKETVKTDLLTKFHVTNNNSNNTLLFNLKLEFFRLWYCSLDCGIGFAILKVLRLLIHSLTQNQRSSLVAQLDRALDYVSRGWGFESLPGGLLFNTPYQARKRNRDSYKAVAICVAVLFAQWM